MGVILKSVIYLVLLGISIVFSQVNINGNDLKIYQFDKNNMTDNDIIIFTPNESVIVDGGKLKLLPKFRNNIARARLRHKVKNGSEIIVKVDNIPYNADGRIKLITSENNYVELMFYDNEGIKSLVISEKIMSNDESYIYRKVTPLSTPIHIKICVGKEKSSFSLGYAGRSFDKFFETDLTLDNFMIQLESSTKIDNPYTSVDIDWVIVSTEK